MDMSQSYTLHALQRMAERAIDEYDIARSLNGTLIRWDEQTQRWYAAGVSVVVNVTGRWPRVVTVLREVLDDAEPTRRRRGRS